MKYRNKKRLVAIWILEQLSITNRAHYVGQATVGTVVETPAYIRPPDPLKVSELVKTNKYEAPLIYEASFFLMSRGYVEPVGMTNDDIANTSIKITDEGINALRDEIFEDEITNYNNDRYYSYSRWILPVLSILVSIVALWFSTCKKSSDKTIQVQLLTQTPQPTDTNKKMQLLRKNVTVHGKYDTTQQKNGQ